MSTQVRIASSPCGLWISFQTYKCYAIWVVQSKVLDHVASQPALRTQYHDKNIPDTSETTVQFTLSSDRIL